MNLFPLQATRFPPPLVYIFSSSKQCIDSIHYLISQSMTSHIITIVHPWATTKLVMCTYYRLKLDDLDRGNCWLSLGNCRVIWLMRVFCHLSTHWSERSSLVALHTYFSHVFRAIQYDKKKTLSWSLGMQMNQDLWQIQQLSPLSVISRKIIIYPQKLYINI